MGELEWFVMYEEVVDYRGRMLCLGMYVLKRGSIVFEIVNGIIV